MNYFNPQNVSSIPPPGIIYAIKSEAGPIKIGFATDMRTRFSQIDANSGAQLSLEYLGECADVATAKKIERKTHEILLPKHCKGEWFSATVEEVISAIEEAAGELGHELKDRSDMKKAMTPRKRGRPPGPTKTGEKPNRSLRLAADMWAAIDEWQRRRVGEPILPRSGAVRTLLELALHTEGIMDLSDETADWLDRRRKRSRK